MKRFHFRLRSIFELRQEQEEAARRTYAEALAASDRAASVLQAARATQSSHWQFTKTKSIAGTTVAELQALRKYSVVLEERIRRAERELQLATRTLQQAEERLTKASQERQIIEKLCERQQRAFDFEQLRLEQKQMDEFASGTSLRGKHGSHARQFT